MSEKKTGAQIVIDVLIREGVKDIFGYPGGAILDVYDELAKAEEEGLLEHILVRHEQAAAHMADAYYRSTGRVGVCMATSGPGATNLTTGLATAYMDGSAMVALTGQVPTGLIGNDAFQEADVCGVTRSITKHNFLVKDVRDLATILRKAFYVARTGKPGPVLVDIPKDVQKATINYEYPDHVEIRSYRPTTKGNVQQIRKVAQAIKSCHKPLIYAGGGAIVAEAHEEVHELAVRAKIPVTTTLMGLGAFPETHALSLEMLGMHGTVTANYAIQECDLLLALGARFDDRVTGKLADFAPHAKIVHIDVDPTSLSKNVRPHIPVVGDLKLCLEELLKYLEPGDYSEWLKQIEEWKAKYPLEYDREVDEIKPQYVIEQIYDLTKGNAIICTDVGQHQMWIAQYYKFTTPRTCLSSGGLGTMGFGLPAALGAQRGNPDKLVINISGDGGIQMNLQELTTAVLNGLPVKVVILNNNYLGMVRQWQELFYKKVYASTHLGAKPKDARLIKEKKPEEYGYIPDFVRIAEGHGALGFRVGKKQDVRPTLEKAFSTPGVVVMEFQVSLEENVFPMVPAGESLSQVITDRFAASAMLTS
jgi:acetolactate synthase-1/2/3 large subunit